MLQMTALWARRDEPDWHARRIYAVHSRIERDARMGVVEWWRAAAREHDPGSVGSVGALLLSPGRASAYGGRVRALRGRLIHSRHARRLGGRSARRAKARCGCSLRRIWLRGDGGFRGQRSSSRLHPAAFGSADSVALRAYDSGAGCSSRERVWVCTGVRRPRSGRGEEV